MKEFKGKVAVVTGAASGIGRGMAEAFAAAGMKVVLGDIEAPAVEETTRSLRDAGADVHVVVMDVSKQDHVDELAKQTLSKYGAVHVVCNNAGVFVGYGESWRASLDAWNWIMGVNLLGVVHGLRTFLPIMIDQGDEAHVVNTASLGGLIAGGVTLYGTTKFAVVGLSENVYSELKRGAFKPNISVLCPGFVNTKIMDSHRNRPSNFPDAAAPEIGPVAEQVREFRRRAADALKNAMSPREVGEKVLAGIREKRFYILTHPNFNPAIEQRMTDILNGNNPMVTASPELLKKMNLPAASAEASTGREAR
jgi:NAD(P)-dependent dehydrogenase (short-subunit alcohol dehydrogenase family)